MESQNIQITIKLKNISSKGVENSKEMALIVAQ